MQRMLMGAALALTLGAPAMAGLSDVGPNPEGRALVPANSLLGQAVTTADGQRLGKVGFVAFGARDGNLGPLLLEPVDGRGLVALPWRVGGVTLAQGGGLRLDRTSAEVGDLPRMAADRLADLTNPSMARQVAAAFAPAGVVRAVNPGAQTGQKVVSEKQSPEERVLPGEGSTGTDSPRTTSWDNVPPEVKASDAESRPLVLLGAAEVRVLSGPALGTVGQFRGAPVADGAGRPLGEIDAVMLDPAAGRVAYLLLDRTPDGKPAAPSADGRGLVPLPFGRLAPAADGAGLVHAGTLPAGVAVAE